ncbi:unnamed protein product [Hyaloperonospora brassicae]|uniref:Uncharacterized protein n=1 Tax=Hyaloperonospora brassicae TaxID=162125 RepID=A0AAV0UZ51_HYABA|nr:unnamed protein product [Hyaloperonospora brassicae]
MELLEDVYVDELIDAFDAPEVKPAAPTGLSDESHRQHRRAPFRQRTQSALELRTTRPNPLPSLYPVFGESRALKTLPDAAVGAATVPCEPHQPREATSLLERQVPLSRQTFCDSQVVTDGALQRARQQIEREMRMYKARLDHVAKALAGETAHQIRARKQREEEQLARRGKRCEAVETRLLHQLNRLEERKQRRTRTCLTGRHRVSRSLSPGTVCTSRAEHGESGAKETERL